MRHTPVTLSPASSARSTGAAPRHRGSSEKCRLTIGSAGEHMRLDQLPERDDHAQVGAGEERVVDLVHDGEPESIAASFTGLGVNALPRPRRLSARGDDGRDVEPARREPRAAQRRGRVFRGRRGAAGDAARRSRQLPVTSA
jgi:hypothetical protein